MARKSLKEEIQVVRYMTELSKPTFDYLHLCITSGDKDDKQWAVEQMMKLYPKAIPTELIGDPENPLTHAITGINYIVPNGDNTTTNTEATPSVPSTSESSS